MITIMLIRIMMIRLRREEKLSFSGISSKSCVRGGSYCTKYVVLTPLETVAYCYFDMKRFNEAIMSFRFHNGSPHLNHMLVGQ